MKTLWQNLLGFFLLALVFGSGVRADDLELIVVSPHWEGLRQEIADGFSESAQKKFGKPVKVRWLDLGGTADILRYIKSEFTVRESGIGIDILFGGGLDPYLELGKLNLLDPYQAPWAAEIPETVLGSPLRDLEGRWYSVTLAAMGIVYNKQIYKLLGVPFPHRWSDLGDPRLRTWIGSADPGRSGAAHLFYEILLQGYGWNSGWRLVYSIGANLRGFGATAGSVPKDVVDGEVAAGFALDSYAREAIARGGEENIGFKVPEDAFTVNGDAVGIIKGAPSRDLARAFIDYVMSREAQRLLLLPKGHPSGPKRYYLGKLSVRPELYSEFPDVTADLFNPFTAPHSFTFNNSLAADRRSIVSDLLTIFLVERGDRLRQAAIAVEKTGKTLSEVLPPPFDETELKRLIAEKTWTSQRTRNENMHGLRVRAYDELGAYVSSRRYLQTVFTALFVILLLFSIRRTVMLPGDYDPEDEK